MSQNSGAWLASDDKERGPQAGAPREAAVQASREAATGWLANLRYDAPAGLVVFLVALPLCLGIALASGAPLVSGLITGIMAGLVVAPLGGSPLSVSGPAAGLTIIVLNAIQSLGSFPAFLLALVFAGVLQFGLGLVKAGTIASYFPSSVIKGMLSAIGIILILKQIPHAVGYDADPEGDETFLQADHENSFSEIGTALGHLNGGAIIIGLVALAILFAWTRPALKKLTVVPAPLVVVVVGVLLGRLFSAFVPALAPGQKHMVTLPVLSSFKDVGQYITLPDFSQITNPKVYMVAVTLAIIASLETLLSVEAVDKLDPQKRASDTNRELRAQGIGNLLSALVGGLPMTAVIVRSSANVNAGGRTKRAAMVHSALLLVSVLLIPSILNLIPLAALAGILIFTGFKLASPAMIKGMFKAGWDQFIPFAVTIVAILFTDLLKGIGIGIAVGIFYILRTNYRSAYALHREEHTSGERIRIELSEHVSFLNKAAILLTLRRLPDGAVVQIDGTKSLFIDYDVLELIHDFTEGASERNIQVELKAIPPIVRAVGAH